MAERNIMNVLYKLRGDTLSNWSTKNPVLAEREPAIVMIPADSGSGLNEPAVLLKIGDGTTAFNDLGYVSAIAGDVPAWAKEANKPSYEAKEITGIDAYIAAYVNEQMGISVDTDTQYTIVPVDGNAYQYKLMSKSKADEQFATEVAVIDIPKYDDTALAGRVSDLEGLVGNTAVSAQIAAAIEALKLADTYEAKGAAAAVQGDTTSTVKDVEDALNTYKTDNDAAVAAAKKAGDDAQTAVDTLAGKVGEVPADKTVVQMIVDAQTAATYDDTQVKADIKANADAIDVLNGSGEGSVDKKITDAFNDFSTKVTDDAVINSYKELIDWAAEHGSEAAEMAAAITTLQNILEGIGGEGESATVVAYVNSAIEALKIGDYAKATDLTALAERVAAMEAKVPNWDAAEQNAKDHADDLNEAMGIRVKALEDVGATKVEASETNGNIKINGTETPVYVLPASVLDAGDTFIFDGGKA